MDQARTELLATEWTKAQRPVASYINAVLRDFHQTEEVLQRVAVAVVRKFDQYDADRPFVPWAIGIARFEVLNYRRELATDKHVFGDALLDRITAGYQRMAEAGEPYAPGETLSECIRKVRGRARKALSLRYVEGKDATQIARDLHTSSGAVRMLLMRTRETLRRCIEDAGGVEEAMA